MAYWRGLVHGTICGIVVGVLVAPRSGRETRVQLERSARRWTGRGQRVAAGTESAWRQAEPVVRAAAKGMGGLAHTAHPLVERAAQRVAEIAARRGETIDAVAAGPAPAGPGANGRAAGSGPPDLGASGPTPGADPGARA